MVREASTGDLGLLLELYRQFFPEENYSNPEEYMEVWQQILSDEKIICLLAFDGERAVSTCTVTVIPNLTRGRRSYALIENVFTDEAYRRKGYGRMVMDEAVRLAEEQGCYKVMLLSGSARTESHEFYRRIGFDGDAKKGFQVKFS